MLIVWRDVVRKRARKRKRERETEREWSGHGGVSMREKGGEVVKNDVFCKSTSLVKPL